MGRKGRRCRQLISDFKEMTEYWKLTEEALDCALWRASFGSGYGPVVRETRNDGGVSWNLYNERFQILNISDKQPRFKQGAAVLTCST